MDFMIKLGWIIFVCAGLLVLFCGYMVYDCAVGQEYGLVVFWTVLVAVNTNTATRHFGTMLEQARKPKEPRHED